MTTAIDMSSPGLGRVLPPELESRTYCTKQIFCLYRTGGTYFHGTLFAFPLPSFCKITLHSNLYIGIIEYQMSGRQTNVIDSNMQLLLVKDSYNIRCLPSMKNRRTYFYIVQKRLDLLKYLRKVSTAVKNAIHMDYALNSLLVNSLLVNSLL